MTITLETRSPCLLCGYLHRVVMVATVRINKRSMRMTGPMLEANVPQQIITRPRPPGV